MKKFKVEVKEIHIATYIVEAENLTDALQPSQWWEEVELVNCEFSHMDDVISAEQCEEDVDR